LVASLLVVDPRARPTAEAVFKTPWMTENPRDQHIPGFSATWQKYALKRKFKSAVLAVLADHRFQDAMDGPLSSQITPPSRHANSEPTPPTSAEPMEYRSTF